MVSVDIGMMMEVEEEIISSVACFCYFLKERGVCVVYGEGLSWHWKNNK